MVRQSLAKFPNPPKIGDRISEAMRQRYDGFVDKNFRKIQGIQSGASKRERD
jgi:hypothetical protein